MTYFCILSCVVRNWIFFCFYLIFYFCCLWPSSPSFICPIVTVIIIAVKVGHSVQMLSQSVQIFSLTLQSPLSHLLSSYLCCCNTTATCNKKWYSIKIKGLYEPDQVLQPKLRVLKVIDPSSCKNSPAANFIMSYKCTQLQHLRIPANTALHMLTPHSSLTKLELWRHNSCLLAILRVLTAAKKLKKLRFTGDIDDFRIHPHDNEVCST